MYQQQANKFHAGWYDFDNGKRYYMRSGFEARWGKYLDFLVKAGEVVSWEFEPRDFEVKGMRKNTKRYWPDFRVVYSNNTVLWHETKGQIKSSDVTKLRRMSQEYPEEKIVLVMQRIPQGHSKSAVGQRVLIDKARMWVERVIEAEPILKKVGI